MSESGRREVRKQLERIILSGGKKSKTRKKKGGTYEFMEMGAGIYAGKKRKSTRKSASGLRAYGITKKPANPWVKHVKQYAKSHGLTYGEALSSPGAKRSYHSGMSMSKKKA